MHVLHVPKTGGAALKEAIRPHLRGSRYAVEVHGHGVRLRDVPRGEGVIVVLRDPVGRFASAFAFRQRQGRPRFPDPWSDAEAAAFARFPGPNELARALDAADPAERAAAVAAMRGIIHVNTSLWDWFGDERYLRSRAPDLAFVGFQETLAADFERLKTLLGPPASTQLPADDFRANRSPTPPPPVDERARRNLHAWYARDYEAIRCLEELVLAGPAPIAYPGP